MNRLYRGNFHFEHTLAAAGSFSLSKPQKRLNEELTWCWLTVADDGDCLWTSNRLEPGFLQSLAGVDLPAVHCLSSPADIDETVEVCPWGWTKEAAQFAQSVNSTTMIPPLDAVRRVNSRRFSFALEKNFGVALSSAVEVTSVAHLESVLARLAAADAKWVLKAEFGMSARERILGAGRGLQSQTRNWVEKRIRNGGVVFFEPWVRRIAEAGIQFDIPPTGSPTLLAVTPLFSDDNGQYCGSRFDADAANDAEWAQAVAIGHRVAEPAQAAGYFGPLGIDAVRYRDADGSERVRPIQDLNARWTMGRLSLGLRRLLRSGETGIWRHLRWPTDSLTAPQRAFAAFLDELPAGVRAIRTAPFSINDLPVAHGSVALMSKRSPADSRH
ncbi:MAG: hypothetical protein IID45_13500 [Planctomycetes bacterium]|nr:hypothetical protein [Planctomycetota bacterium]